MTSGDWAQCLAALEVHLQRQREAVERGEPDAIELFVPPDGLGPLPSDLLPRAQHLQAQSAELEAALEQWLRVTGQSLATVRQPGATGAGAAYLDSRA